MYHNISFYRYKHIQGVVKLSIELSAIYNIDQTKCMMASLLHDITKEMSREQQLTILGKMEITDQLVLDTLALWHGFSASQYVQDHYKVDDLNVIEAIKYHTIGTNTNNDIFRVLFVADYLEENRNYPSVIKLRKQIGLDLKQLTKLVAKDKVRDQKLKDQTVHSNLLGLIK